MYGKDNMFLCVTEPNNLPLVLEVELPPPTKIERRKVPQSFAKAFKSITVHIAALMSHSL